MKNSFFKPIKELFKGLFTVLKNGFKTCVTLEYPERKKELNSTFRGKIKYIKEKCIKCGICKNVCPVKDNITIENEFIINLSSCIFCGNCVENCPKQALVFTNEFELATEKKNELITKESLE